MRKLTLELLVLTVLLSFGCANNNDPRLYLSYNVSDYESSFVSSNKEAILFLSVKDGRSNVDIDPLENSSGLPNSKLADKRLTEILVESVSYALESELNMIDIEVTEYLSEAQAHFKVVIRKVELSEEGKLGHFSSIVDIDFELVRSGGILPLLKGTLHGEHKILNAAFTQAIAGLRQNLKFKKLIADLEVYSPEYLANQKVLTQIKAALIPLDSKFRIVTNSAKVRKMPRTDSEVITEIGIGSIIQIIGKLPSGWMQVAKEGESIGWIHRDSVVIDSTVPPSSRQQQAQTKKEPTPQSGTGSGFFVSKMGHVITNAHVVRGCQKLTVGDNANKQVTAELINTDSSNDLALLKLSSLEMASAESKSLIQKLSIVVVPLSSKGLLRSENVKLGEKVLVAGYPFGELFSNTIKVTSGIVSATRGAGDDTGQFQLDAAVQPGNSGGPIYDSSGNIVGVVVAQLDKLKMAKAIGSLPENVNFGIKASTVKQFLISSGLPSKKAEQAEEKSTQQLAEIAKNQALMVMCLQ